MVRWIALGLLMVVGCARSPVPEVGPAASAFRHDDFDRFLARHVDTLGRIDYQRAREDRADLDRYLEALAGASPDRAPARFPGQAARLAYWLNAYNASVIDLVLDHYPIGSVRDVRPPVLLRFLPRGAGFFFLERVELGGRRISLYTLENRVIRKRFSDPRIHFALNCASASCPRLPAEAFRPAQLEDQLRREAARFLAEPRNVRIDLEARRISLSSIFDWYRGDFERSAKDRSLRGYLAEALAPELAGTLARCDDCGLDFVPYDWSLNDQPRMASLVAPRRSASAGSPVPATQPSSP